MKKDDAVDISYHPGKSSRLPGMTARRPRPSHPGATAMEEPGKVDVASTRHERPPLRAAVALMVIALTGCSAQGALTAASTAADVAPKVIGGAEQLRSAITVAPIAGCVELLQQTQLQLQALQNGTPGIPVSPSPDVPPILSVPPPSPSSSYSHLPTYTRPVSLHKQVAADRQAEWLAVQRVGRAAYERRLAATFPFN